MSEIRVNTIVAAEGTSAPNLPYGIQVPTGMGITGAGGLNITGVVTAANIDGTLIAGSAINSAGVSTVGILTVTKDARIGAAVTVDGAATVTGALTGSTGTYSGAVNIDATTDSTSVTTGALIVDGGVGIAKNVYIGAGLSIAGTLTYEDVTNVDSVGLITAKSGVNISGGELKVGSAVTVSGVGVVTFIGAGGIGVTITPSTGKVQATTFEGPLTGNVTGDLTGDLTGTVNTAAQTSITSVGTLAGLTVGSAGEFKVGTAVTIASTSGVSTFAANVQFIGDAGKSCLWNKGNGAFELNDNARVKIGSGADLSIYHDATNSYIENTTGNLFLKGDYVNIRSSGNEQIIETSGNGSVALFYNSVKSYETTGAGSTSVGISTFQDFSSIGMLKERVEVIANKLSAATNINLDSGNIHYFSTNETTTATPNIRYSSAQSLNNKMLIGEAVTVTIIYKPNGAGYYAALTVDGANVTEEWNGGDAPSSANSDGYDVLTHTLTKIGNDSWICLSNVQNYT